jgi:hypothetical protein
MKAISESYMWKHSVKALYKWKQSVGHLAHEEAAYASVCGLIIQTASYLKHHNNLCFALPHTLTSKQARTSTERRVSPMGAMEQEYRFVDPIDNANNYSTRLHPSVSINKVMLIDPLYDTISKALV